MMVAVQLMCARLTMVTGRGLASAVRQHYPRWVLWGACALLVTANVVNIGADLAGMAEATEMVTGIPSLLCTPLYAAGILALMVWTSYRHVANILRWLTLVLLAYVAAAFLARPQWGAVIKATVLPGGEWSSAYITLSGGFDALRCGSA